MKYTKKPVVIHAFRYGHDKEPAWFKNEEGALWSRDFDEPTAPILLEIYGKEIIVTKGDWIILDAKDKLYSCNHHIFITTYEPTK